MSTTGDQNTTQESQDNPLTLEAKWVQEAAEGGGIGHKSGLDGVSATPEVEEVMVVHPREVDNVGPERNPEEKGNRGECEDAEEDPDTRPDDDDEESVTVDPDAVVNAHHFPMADFRFMFLDLVNSILNRVCNNDHFLSRSSQEDREMETPDTSAVGHSSEVQEPLGPIPSTTRASEYGRGGSIMAQSLREIISTFPELEESADFEETEDYYLYEPVVRVVKNPAQQAIREVAAEATAEEPGKEVIKQIMASEGKERPRRLGEVINTGQWVVVGRKGKDRCWKGDCCLG